MLSRKTPIKRSAFKKKARKKRAWQDKSMLEACRGQACFLAIPGVCCGDWTTCVPAHRNEGKGLGMKTPDALTVPACFTCHTEYDQGKRFTRDEKRAMWDAAYESWSAYRDSACGTARI
jgi:hypothetical protein